MKKMSYQIRSVFRHGREGDTEMAAGPEVEGKEEEEEEEEEGSHSQRVRREGDGSQSQLHGSVSTSTSLASSSAYTLIQTANPVFGAVRKLWNSRDENHRVVSDPPVLFSYPSCPILLPLD